MLIQESENFCSKLKTGKLKTERLLKTTIQTNKSPEYNQHTEPKQCKSEVEEICIHQNLETGSIVATISENK